MARAAAWVPGTAERRREQLDGLRWFLFLSIFTLHHFTQQLEFLAYAVPVFFSLSGFLVTRVLWELRGASVWQNLKTFYIRRTLRIFPPYYVFLAFLIPLAAIQYPLSYALYYVNVKIFVMSLQPNSPEFTWLWSAWDKQSLQMWSLAVEEQFYIVYPILFFALASRRKLSWLFGAALAVGIGSRVYLMRVAPQSFYGFLLPCCLEYFAWGGFFAIAELQGRLKSLRTASWSLPAAAAGIVALIAIEYGYGFNGYFQCRTTHFATALAPLMGLFVWRLWVESDDNRAVRFLNAKPLPYLGKLSYSTYLVHLATFGIYRAYLSPLIDAHVLSPAWRTGCFYVGTLVITVAIAAAIWHAVEVPAAALKRYFPLAGSTGQRGVRVAFAVGTAASE